MFFIFLQKLFYYIQSLELFVTHKEKNLFLSHQQIAATTCAILAFVECR